MSKTAEQLREEIGNMLPPFNRDGDLDYKWADEIINKLLDAIEEGIMEAAKNINIATDRGEGLYDGMAIRSIREVRKLRPNHEN